MKKRIVMFLAAALAAIGVRADEDSISSLAQVA